MYSQWPRQRFYATPKSHSWERTPWGGPTAGASGVSVKSSIVQQGCRAWAALQITGRHTGEMQQGKGRFPSPVLGAGTVGPRRQWVQTPGAPTDCKTSSPLRGFGWWCCGPARMQCSCNLGKGLCEMSWERLHQELIPSLGGCLCSSPRSGSLTLRCCSYVWAWPRALLVLTCWFEFWLDCGPISSYRHVWRPGLLAGPGYHPWTSSTRCALPCLVSPVGSPAPGWPSCAEKTHFGSSPTYPL